MNAQGLGIYGLTLGTSSREKGRLTIQLSVMSLKKKKLLSKKNFLVFVTPHKKEEDSYYSKHNDEDGEKLKEAYETLFIKPSM